MKSFPICTTLLGLLFTCVTTFGEQPATSGLVLYFPLESTRQQTIKDLSGQHNNGKATVIIVSNSPSLVSMQQTRQLTFMVWIKPNSIPNEFPVLLSKSGNEPGGAYGGYEFLLNANGDNDLLFASGATFWVAHNANGRSVNNHLGEWIHVAFTLDDQTKVAKFYVNGQATDDAFKFGTDEALNFELSNNLYVGVPDPASNSNRAKFDGTMQNLMLFKRVLTESEIQKAFKLNKAKLTKK